MRTGEFLNQVDHAMLVKAIEEVELRTSGEVRVFVSRQGTAEPVATATAHFKRLGMEKTRERNAVLFFVAPVSQTFAVVGDQAVHEHCGQEFWTAVAGEMTEHFKRGDYTGGLVLGIRKAGDLLARHFPRAADDVNELPNKIEEE